MTNCGNFFHLQHIVTKITRQITAAVIVAHLTATFTAGATFSGPGEKQAATTYYVDSVTGRNTNTGSSPDSPWQDFYHINGKTLKAGERLLIKRGSVINQELRIGAQGSADRWVEIGAYGDGARPVLRRNWHIGDRCALIQDPDYLRIGSLAFSHAGKGLVVHYAKPGHAGLVIEDCIAHHIEGIYREWTICSGIPEWRGYAAPTDDGFRASAGIAVTGRGRDITIRDCDIFQTSWGFWVAGEQVTLDRLYVHHCYTFNSSPHPALLGPKDSVMQNCIFDASGYHAFAGTMGIMLGRPRNLTIRNCTFRNQPDSGSHDEGGIDFENGGDGCLIDNCTFENNAGAAIEVLGLQSPQPKNVEIRRSRFIENNWAKKLGPSEIFIWGSGKPNPRVCCSTGTIESNGCVLVPGVEFFVNQAPTTTQWTLENNTTFVSVAELEKAMPYNKPPVVEAGPDLTSDRLTVQLAGSVSDDGNSAGSQLVTRWELLEGPGYVSFKDSGSANCGADFSRPGDYLLRLVGDDGQLWTSDVVTAHILPRGISVARAWEFDTPLDKEGWSEADLGTREQVEPPVKGQNGTSLPVKYVAGGYYIIAIDAAPDARLISADNLNVALNPHQSVRLRCQNHTTSARMAVRFTTIADDRWDDVKSKAFVVTPNDNDTQNYMVDLSQVPGWTGTLKQLRLDLTAGEAATGTVRVDSIRIENGRATED